MFLDTSSEYEMASLKQCKDAIDGHGKEYTEFFHNPSVYPVH